MVDQEIDPYRIIPVDPDCPLCGHAWRRHDPDDGCCDAPGYGILGPCPCGRNRLWMAGRIAHLSKLFLSRPDGGASGFDGGTLELGIVRDPILGPSDERMFVETQPGAVARNVSGVGDL